MSGQGSVDLALKYENSSIFLALKSQNSHINIAQRYPTVPLWHPAEEIRFTCRIGYLYHMTDGDKQRQACQIDEQQFQIIVDMFAFFHVQCESAKITDKPIFD